MTTSDVESVSSTEKKNKNPFRNMALTFSTVNAREWMYKARERIKPWSVFFAFSKYKAPKSLTTVKSRVVTNITHFQSNYLFVFLGLILFCLLTSPMLLFAVAACLGACYLVRLRMADTSLKIRGYEISIAHQYMIIGILSFPLFWLAGAGSAVFWVIGASMFVIVLHASVYTTEAELEDDVEVLTMEDV